MSTEYDERGLPHWTSRRFAKDLEGLCPSYHFFPDNDPRIMLLTDGRGDEYWLVGYSTGVDFTCETKGPKHLLGNLLVVRVKDWAFMGIHPSTVEGYPPNLPL